MGEAVDFVSGLLDSNPAKGLYFPYELTNAQPPESVSYSVGESTAGTGLNTSSLSVTSSFDLKQGKVHVGGSEFQEMNIITSLKAGDSFSFDKVKYLLVKGKYCDINELLYDSEKILFYSVNSMNRVPTFPKFRIRKSDSATEWEPKSLSESAWKKSLKEFFSDCSSIATNVIDKGSLTNEEFPKILCDYYVKSCN